LDAADLFDGPDLEVSPNPPYYVGEAITIANFGDTGGYVSATLYICGPTSCDERDNFAGGAGFVATAAGSYSAIFVGTYDEENPFAAGCWDSCVMAEVDFEVYAVQPEPTISSISFASSPVAGASDRLTITGSNLGVSGFVEACPTDGSGGPCIQPDSTTWGTGATINIGWTIPSWAAGVAYCVDVAVSRFDGTGTLPAICALAFYVPAASPPTPSVQIMQGSTVVSGRAANNPVVLSVGQQVQLTAVPTNLPNGVIVTGQTNWAWTIQGTTVKNYQQTLDYTAKTSRGVETDLVSSDLTGAGPTATPGVTFYWIDGDDGSHSVNGCSNVNSSLVACAVTYTATLTLSNDTQVQVSAWAGFDPLRPSVTMTGKSSGTAPQIHVVPSGGTSYLEFGYVAPPDSTNDPGMTYKVTASTSFDGSSFAWVQLTTTSQTDTKIDGSPVNVSVPNYVLDDNPNNNSTGYPQYGGQKNIAVFSTAGSASFSTNDSPISSLAPYNAFNRTDKFQTYLMYLPPGANSIWVTIQEMDWGWNGSTTLSGSGWGPVQSNSPAFTANPTGGRSTTLPQWGSYISSAVKN
jgi:hypothetical protein